MTFYLEDKYSFYLNSNYIKNIYLCDNKDKYEITPNKLSKKDGYIIYDTKKLIQYDLNVKISYSFNDIFKIPKCNILIEYEKIKPLNMNIGSFALISIMDNEKIYISGYKGIINNKVSLNNSYYPTIVGTILTIKNAENQDVLIKRIISTNGHLEIEQNKIEEIRQININNDIEINDILNKDYNLIYKNNNSMFNYQFNNETINLLIPISYSNIMMTNICGFIIEYIIDNNVYYEVITNLILFTSNKLSDNYNVYEF